MAQTKISFNTAIFGLLALCALIVAEPITDRAGSLVQNTPLGSLRPFLQGDITPRGIKTTVPEQREFINQLASFAAALAGEAKLLEKDEQSILLDGLSFAAFSGFPMSSFKELFPFLLADFKTEKLIKTGLMKDLFTDALFSKLTSKAEVLKFFAGLPGLTEDERIIIEALASLPAAKKSLFHLEMKESFWQLGTAKKMYKKAAKLNIFVDKLKEKFAVIFGTTTTTSTTGSPSTTSTSSSTVPVTTTSTLITTTEAEDNSSSTSLSTASTVTTTSSSTTDSSTSTSTTNTSTITSVSTTSTTSTARVTTTTTGSTSTSTTSGTTTSTTSTATSATSPITSTSSTASASTVPTTSTTTTSTSTSQSTSAIESTTTTTTGSTSVIVRRRLRDNFVY